MSIPRHDETKQAVRQIRARLRRVRRAGRAFLTTRVVSWLFVYGMGITAVLVMADLLMRFPMALRAGLLTGFLLLMAAAVRRRLLPVARFKPRLSDVALRVERWLAARGHDPAGPIASGIGVPIDDTDPLTRRLSRIVAAEAASGLRATPWGLLRWGKPGVALAAVVASAVAVSVVSNAQPTLAVTGLTRLFMPWVDAPWPKRTEIADATPTDPHPSDTALPLRASLLKSGRPEGESTVRLSYRVVGGEGEPGPMLDAVLAPQPATDDGRGELYERLIEPVAWRSADAGERWLEYRFESGDDRTPMKRVRIVDPPALVGVSSEIETPAYAAGFAERFGGAPSFTPTAATEPVIEIGPVLAGSRLSLELEYNKPVTPRLASERSTIEPGEVVGDDTVVRIGLLAEQTGRLVLDAEDGYGLRTRGPALVRLAVARDTPPEATIIEPAADEAVLATATVPLTGEGRDDLALTSLEVSYEIARPDAGSLGAEPVADGGEPVVLARDDGAPAPSKRVATAMDLSTLGVEPGDEVWVRAVAQDNFDLEGETHEPVLSAPRRLRIIAPAEFVELVQSELEGVRRTAIRLDAQQADVTRRTREAGEGEDEDRRAAELEENARTQTGVSQRLRAQSEMLRRLGERVERNGLNDDAVRALLDQAAETTERAAEASERAAEEVAEQAQGEQADPAEPQQRVREELARLIDQLDRGQDDWVVRRNIEQLLSDQTELRAQTEELAGRTVGRELGDLTPEELTELERIARQQEQLARRAQDSLDQLSERADELREQDPTQAAALDRAAEDAARERLAEMLQQASEQIGQNQTASAGQMQEQSIEALEQMLEQLENAQRNRDDALRRQLASLIASIESLIRQQEAALVPLADGPDRDLVRAAELAQRVHGNTLATEASAREGFSELARVGDLLSRAAELQTMAIVALRERPPVAEEATEAETEALARLGEALEEANRQNDAAEQRERERQRRELRDAYRSALTEQAELRGETAGFAGAELNRRERAELRRIGQRQEALRVRIESIPGEHEAGGVGVLELFHTRIDVALTDAVRSLGRGNADAAVLGKQERAEALLRTILDTLAEQPAPSEDEFGEGAGGGGGGGGGQQGDQPAIQDVEQLRMLRGLQAIVLDDTRRGGDTAGAADLQRRIAEQTRELIQRMQQGPGGQAPRPMPEPEPQPEGPPAESEGDEPGGPTP